jgi:hypothetical protein
VRNGRFEFCYGHYWFFFMPEGSFTCRKPTALLPLRRKWCSGFLSPLKIHRLQPGSKCPVASTLTTSPPRATLLYATSSLILSHLLLEHCLSICLLVNTSKVCEQHFLHVYVGVIFPISILSLSLPLFPNPQSKPCYLTSFLNSTPHILLSFTLISFHCNILMTYFLLHSQRNSVT